jgi:predicted phosphodiesterase
MEFVFESLDKNYSEIIASKIPVLEEDSETTLVLAGDIATGASVHALFSCSDILDRFKYVVCVLGNHDYWGENLHTIPEVWKECLDSYDNLHLLRCSAPLELDGVLFFGDTMWTNFDQGDPDAMQESFMYMNDYRKIHKYVAPIGGLNPTRILASPYDILSVHHHQTRALYRAMGGYPVGMPKVVVTHHTPSLSSSSGSYRHKNSPDLLTYSYSCNKSKYVDLIIDKIRPDMWIHGHTHHPVDYMLKDTNVVHNPVGYPNEALLTKDKVYEL